ncbi:putative ribonuclease H-like domain-containing protein, partial [Tanacetum coccineum]
MLEFYGNKGIKQEYSNARTPQQNGVAERMKVVIEARTMTVEDLLHLVPNLFTKVDSLETELKQTKLTMGKAIVKL